ncbi:MAG: aminotransferase class I/II-fold pyridoxal phosphate-dependent enzyme [Pseudomonadota bacterium]
MSLDLHTAEAIPERARTEVEAALQSGDLFRYHSQNAPVTLLEQEFAAMMGTRFALAVASCSAALFLSMRALDLPKGAKVLIPGFTFAAVPSAVVHADCVPVLVEVGENYRMDMSDFENKLTDDIAAIIVSHMRGHTSDMTRIMELADQRGIPVIEDAAHSLGTVWDGQKIGTMGKIGCFSFQSYKLLNAGEGGILITDDEDVIARAIIMSGAYETNWQKHGMKTDAFGKYQNQLPLYNTRLSNLSAILVRAQLPEVARRASDGLRNHDVLASQIAQHPIIDVPAPLEPEERAPDSIQFNLIGVSDAQAKLFMGACNDAGLGLSIFGMHQGNARAFWNWGFLGETPELPQTRNMLMRACDLRLPARLHLEEVIEIGDIILKAADSVRHAVAAE